MHYLLGLVVRERDRLVVTVFYRKVEKVWRPDESSVRFGSRCAQHCIR
jgi:hypothetical protein